VAGYFEQEPGERPWILGKKTVIDHPASRPFAGLDPRPPRCAPCWETVSVSGKRDAVFKGGLGETPGVARKARVALALIAFLSPCNLLWCSMSPPTTSRTFPCQKTGFGSKTPCVSPKRGALCWSFPTGDVLLFPHPSAGVAQTGSSKIATAEGLVLLFFLNAGDYGAI